MKCFEQLRPDSRRSLTRRRLCRPPRGPPRAPWQAINAALKERVADRATIKAVFRRYNNIDGVRRPPPALSRTPASAPCLRPPRATRAPTLRPHPHTHTPRASARGRAQVWTFRCTDVSFTLGPSSRSMTLKTDLAEVVALDAKSAQ